MTRAITLAAILCISGSYSVADDPANTADQTKTESNSATQPPESKKSVDKPASAIDEQLLKALDKKAIPGEEVEEQQPLVRAGKRMREVQGRLTQVDTGTETRTIQKEIVDDLDNLIESIKKKSGDPNKSPKKDSNPKRNTSNKNQAPNEASNDPAADSNPSRRTLPPEGARRTGDASQLVDRQIRAIWGHLPEKMKEEMQQAFRESDLPKYRGTIQQYFRAIAEQK